MTRLSSHHARGRVKKERAQTLKTAHSTESPAILLRTVSSSRTRLKIKKGVKNFSKEEKKVTSNVWRISTCMVEEYDKEDVEFRSVSSPRTN